MDFFALDKSNDDLWFIVITGIVTLRGFFGFLSYTTRSRRGLAQVTSGGSEPRWRLCRPASYVFSGDTVAVQHLFLLV